MKKAPVCGGLRTSATDDAAEQRMSVRFPELISHDRNGMFFC